MPIKKTLWQIEKFIVYRVLHADDTPHRLALGIALGVFIAWTPTIGLQMILVLLLSSLFCANRVVGLPFVWISNPFTAAPVYFINYCAGHYVLSTYSERPRLSYAQLSEQMSQIFHPEAAGDLLHWSYWRNLINVVLDLSGELWLGSLLLGLILGGVAYIISYRGIRWYREHSPMFRRRGGLRLMRRQKRNLE